MSTPLVIYVDVDDTLVRSVGSKSIPIGIVVDHVRALAADGAVLYCWSSGGSEYARSVAESLGLARCFVAFLPKPLVMIDDQSTSEWRRLLQIHPAQCSNWTAEQYRQAIENGVL